MPALRYTRVSVLADRVRELRDRLGPDATIHIAKVDIEAAYRQICLRWRDVWQQCYWWKGHWYVDLRLPFGLASAPNHFTRVSRAVVFMMLRLHFWCTAYLDDFALCEPAEACAQAVATLLALLQELGLPVQQAKLAEEGTPACVATFLGIVVDTVAMELRLTEERLASMRTLLSEWGTRKRAKLQEVQSLAGTLSFAASVVRPGRLYTARIFEATRGAARRRNRTHWITLSPEFQADVAWWQQVGLSWPGRAIIPAAEPLSSADSQFWTDASDVGYGGYCRGKYFYGTWTDEERAWLAAGTFDINVRELIALVFAVEVFGPLLAGLHVIARCDNTTAVSVVDRLSARSQTLLHLLRRLHAAQCRFDITLTARHVPGVENVVADALSRSMLDLFFSLVAPILPEQMMLPAEIREWQRS